jgi:hypothetical protein
MANNRQGEIDMTYQQLIELLLRMDDRYLQQQVCYSHGDDYLQCINAAKVTYFTYYVDDANMPKEGHFVLSFD